MDETISLDFSSAAIPLYVAIPLAVTRSGYGLRFFIFNSNRKLHDSLLMLGYPVVVVSEGAVPTVGILNTPHGIYFTENHNKLLVQILEFAATVEMSHKLMQMLADSGSRRGE